ncbi:outer membrane protein assembly factor BamE [Azoarcus olearius]|nr:outer membrane protein assembly factor BamE [Azoarcus olearius]ANQ85768.1 putative outer membrane lipoprotein OmlA [Azoarcus olearius]
MRSLLIPAFVAASMLAGCSIGTIAQKVDPYRIDIRQGNYVDQAMVSQLKRGMSREQVRFVLGTPLVVDIFRSNRWDYVYRFKPGNGEPEQRVFSVFFVDDKLDHVEGDILAGDPQEAAASQQANRSRVVEVPAESKK